VFTALLTKQATTVTGIFYPVGATDDGWISTLGGFDDSGDLFACGTWSGDPAEAFIRFSNVSIPQGSTIVSSYLRLNGYSAPGTPPRIHKVYANIEIDPDSPTSTVEFNALDLTTAYVQWTPTFVSGYEWIDSTDISTIIQEIVNQGLWVSGNHLIILLKENATAAFNLIYYNSIRVSSGIYKAELHISYQ